MAKRATHSHKLELKIRALSMRVRFLERALKPAKGATTKPEQLNQAREQAEADATRKAVSEFNRKKWLDFCLRNPTFVARQLAAEREKADFLRSRGLKPEPSLIPEQFHRGLKGYRPETDG
jgi:hypothetical protein